MRVSSFQKPVFPMDSLWERGRAEDDRASRSARIIVEDPSSGKRS